MEGLRGRLQAEHRQLLGAAFALDQAWIVQREAAAQLAFQNSLQLAVIDLAVGADGVLEFLRIDLGGLARLEINRAGGEVHGKRDQAGDDVEQQAHGIERGDGRVDLAFDLATAIGVEDRPAGSHLSQQGCDQNTANQAKGSTHMKSPG